jgi:hypothetical protein
VDDGIKHFEGASDEEWIEGVRRVEAGVKLKQSGIETQQRHLAEEIECLEIVKSQRPHLLQATAGEADPGAPASPSGRQEEETT